MKVNAIFLLFALVFAKPVLAIEKPFNTHIQLNLETLNLDANSLIIEVKLFHSYLGASYHVLQKFKTTALNTSIDIQLPEFSFGSIQVNQFDKTLCTTGIIIFNGETLSGRVNEFKDFIEIEGGENEFMQQNYFLPFALSANISNHPSFKTKMVQRTYDLHIGEDQLLEDMYKEYLRNVLSLVRQYPNSLHILDRLYNRADNITLKTLDTTLTIFSEQVLNTVLGRKLKTYIANGKWLINKPDLNTVPLVSVTEKELSLGSIIDSTKYTFIDFWASWCVPCRAFSTSLAQKYADLDTNSLQIISISLDEDTNKWKKALTKDQLPWLNFIAPSYKVFNGDITQLFNIQFIPQSFLFDKKGNIVQMNLSIEELMKIGKE